MTENEKRFSPEELLEIANKEQNLKRGKLTIYFGAAPGVGKTYSMLSDAHARKKEGIDVVVGYVETHGRKETEALLEGLEVIKPLVVEYKGIKLLEVDVDEIIKRKSQLVLIDELAHTNAPGLRNLKRYQDVEELLNANIDVYTTVNVQHVESLKDIIYSITNVKINETIPDKFLINADEIKLVDLPPEELLKRLKDGKVYVKDMAEQAAHKFFKPGNLLALRQLALRIVADKVDEKMLDYMKAHAIAGPWITKERILVGVFASPTAEQLVRAAYRLANEIDTEWVALHIETEKNAEFSEQEKNWLNNALELARSLGGLVVWVKGNDVTREMLNYAINHNVTKIVLGKPRKIKVFHRSIFEKILLEAEGIDVYLLDFRMNTNVIPKKLFKNLKSSRKPLNILWGILIIAFGMLSAFLLKDYLSSSDLMFSILGSLILIALFLGPITSIISSIISVIIFDYLFIPPYFSFAVSDFHYFLSFVVYVLITLLISILATRLKNKIDLLKKSELKSNVLYELSNSLITAQNLEEILSIIINHTRRLFPFEMAIFIEKDGKPNLSAETDGFKINSEINGIVLWSFVNKKPVGYSTQTLSNKELLALPMISKEHTFGVVVFDLSSNKHLITSESKTIIETIIHLGTMTIERIRNSPYA